MFRKKKKKKKEEAEEVAEKEVPAQCSSIELLI